MSEIRRVVRTFLVVFLFAIAAVQIDPTAFGGVASAGEGGRVLNVFTWDGYFDPGVVRAFEEKNGCRLEFTYYDSNETMFEAIGGGGGGYDIITPPGNITKVLYERGVILELNHAFLPNLKNIDPDSSALQQDREMRYCVPYTETITGIGYNRKLVTAEEVASWGLFGEARFAKRLAMLNDMRETFGAALKHLGFSLNSTNPTEVAAAAELLERWKRNIAIFSVDEAKDGLFSGKYAAIQAYNGDILPAALEDPDIGFQVPAEGSTLNSDAFVIGTDTQAPELAHAFVNHMLDAETAARNMESICYYMPNAAAYKLLPEKLRTHPAFHVGKEYLDTCEVVLNLGDKLDIYDAAWGEVLVGR